MFLSGPGAPGSALEVLLSRESVQLAHIDLVCCDSGDPSTSYALAVAASSRPHDRDRLGKIAKHLAPGARLYVYEAQVSGAEARQDALSKDLVLSGYQACQFVPLPSAAVPVAGGASAAQQQDGTGQTQLLAMAQMPSWALGTKASLSLKPRTQQPAASEAPKAASAWTLAAGGEDEDEMIDEDQLLTEADKARPAAAMPDDCEVGQSGRKACKNCSCGRAEAEAAGVTAALTQDMLDNPQSACGNCGLGDAFRCAGCPYRGLPTFEAGKKIQLQADLLAADF